MKKHITNRDKLTNEELAKALAGSTISCRCCIKEGDCDCDEICSNRIKEWLESEVDRDG